MSAQWGMPLKRATPLRSWHCGGYSTGQSVIVLARDRRTAHAIAQDYFGVAPRSVEPCTLAGHR